MCCSHNRSSLHCYSLFFFNDTATTEIYTLSLHDALPISQQGVHLCAARTQRSRRPFQSDGAVVEHPDRAPAVVDDDQVRDAGSDRKSTRLNSSHANISYAVFCLKKKKNRA